MTSHSPHVQFLSSPEDLVEIEQYCPRCKDCWPLTSEFWWKDLKRPSGFSRNCKACNAESRNKVRCTAVPDTPSKTCVGCKKVKPLTKACWHTRADSPDGFRGTCIECITRSRNERRAMITALVVPPPPAFVMTPDTLFKVCRICFEIKPNDLAFWHKSPRDGLRTECKACRKVKNDGPRRKRSAPPVELAPLEDRIYGIRRLYVQKTDAPTLACRSCKQSKALTTEFFARNTKSPTGFKLHCKVCCSAYERATTKKRKDALMALKENEPMLKVGRSARRARSIKTNSVLQTKQI